MAAQKGNDYAKKARVWTDAIKRAIRAEYGSDWERAVTEAARGLVVAAKNGDVAAFKEIGNRLEGKPTKKLEP